MELNIISKPWSHDDPPKKILVIRYQATGDLVITFPYLNSFKKNYPATELHLLTRKEIKAIPQSLKLFDKVITIGGGRSAKVHFLLTLLKIPFMIFQSYDVVMDLQNHKISRMVRKILFAKAWCEFDRYSPRAAGDRTRLTINALQLTEVGMDTAIDQRMDESLVNKMKQAGWDGKKEIVILNPAGAFETRHWPLDNYVRLAQRWLSVDNRIQFLVTGLRDKIGTQVDFFKNQLGENLIDLTGASDAAEAFALVRKAKLVITEDGGLMHMAWVQGVPTLALFGSSRSDWSRPLGDWSLCLNSSDLPCGNCLLEVCKFGDVHCLTRYTPEFVFSRAQVLLNKRVIRQ